METLRTVFSSCDLLSSSSDITRPVVPSPANMDRRNIIETSSRVGVNSHEEVTNVCVSMLHPETSNSRETRNSRSAWLLVAAIGIEMSNPHHGLC